MKKFLLAVSAVVGLAGAGQAAPAIDGRCDGPYPGPTVTQKWLEESNKKWPYQAPESEHFTSCGTKDPATGYRKCVRAIWYSKALCYTYFSEHFWPSEPEAK